MATNPPTSVTAARDAARASARATREGAGLPPGFRLARPEEQVRLPPQVQPTAPPPMPQPGTPTDWLPDVIQGPVERAGQALGLIDPGTYYGLGNYGENAIRPDERPTISAAPVLGWLDRATRRAGEMASDAGEGVNAMFMRGAGDARDEQSIRGWAQLQGMTPEQADALVAQSRENRARMVREQRAQRDIYWADQDARSADGVLPWVSRFSSDMAGGLVGDANPTYLYAPGASWATRILGQGGVNAATDIAVQGGEMREGIQDQYDPGRTLMEFLAGAAFQGAGEVLGAGARRLGRWWEGRNQAPVEPMVEGALDAAPVPEREWFDPQMYDIGRRDAAEGAPSRPPNYPQARVAYLAGRAGAPLPGEAHYRVLQSGATPEQVAAMSPDFASLAASRLSQAQTRGPVLPPPAGRGEATLRNAVETGVADPSLAQQPVSRVVPDNVPIFAAQGQPGVRADDLGAMMGASRYQQMIQDVLARADARAADNPAIAAIRESSANAEQQAAAIWRRLGEFQAEGRRLPDVALPDVPAPALRPDGVAAAPPSPARRRAVQPAPAGNAREQFKASVRASESSGNDGIINPRGTASGRYQFIESTFKLLYQRVYGVSAGEAARVWNSPSRFDPQIQERLMDAATAGYSAALRRAGVPETSGNLYLSHFLGPDEALRALRVDPRTPTSAHFSARVINSNPEVMRGKTVGDVIAWTRQRMGEGSDVPSSTPANPETTLRAGDETELRRRRTEAGELPLDRPARGYEDTSAPTSPTRAQRETGDTRGWDPQSQPQQEGQAFRPATDDPQGDPGFWERRAQMQADELRAEWERAQAEAAASSGARREQDSARTASEGDASTRYGGKYDQKPAQDGDLWRFTDDGYVAGKNGNPVAFRSAREAAAWAAANRMGGDVEPAVWAANSKRMTLRRRDGSTYGQAAPDAGPAQSEMPGTEQPGGSRFTRTEFERTRPRAGRRPGDPMEQIPGDTGAGPAPDAGPSAPPPPSPQTPPRTAPYRGQAEGPRSSLTEEVVTANGRHTVQTRFEVVEARDLISSDDARFDQALQPRDRGSRAASDAQIAEIASKLDPEQLRSSRLASGGAPIVGPDGMVESGNGRTAAVRRAYEMHPERAAEYRQMIERQGFDTTGMDQPVLIRRRQNDMTPADRAAFTRAAQPGGTMRMSPTEQAKADAQSVPPEVIGQYRGGDINSAANRDFVRGFMDQVVDPTERNALQMGDGSLSVAGIERVRSAMLAKAYDNAPLIEKIVADPDTEIKAIGNVLTDLAPSFAQLKAKIEAGDLPAAFDITPQIGEIAGLIAQARRDGRLLTEYIDQTDIFSGNVDPITEALAHVMMKGEGLSTARSAKDVKDGLSFYVQDAQRVAPDVFGTDMESRALEIAQAAAQMLKARDAAKGGDDLFRAARPGTASDAPRAPEPLRDRLAQVARTGTEDQAALALRLRDALPDGATVSYGREGMSRPSNRGEAEPSTGRAFVADPNDVETVLHEAVHLAAMQRYGAAFENLKPGDVGPARDFLGLFNEARDRFAKGGMASRLTTGFEAKYALSNPDEFLAMGLTDPATQRFLDKGSLWDRFVDGVRRLIGLEPRWRSMLGDVLRTGGEVIDSARGGNARPEGRAENRSFEQWKSEYPDVTRDEFESGDIQRFHNKAMDTDLTRRSSHYLAMNRQQQAITDWHNNRKLYDERLASGWYDVENPRPSYAERNPNGRPGDPDAPAPVDRGGPVGEQFRLFSPSKPSIIDRVFDRDALSTDKTKVRDAIGAPVQTLRALTEPLAKGISAATFTNDSRLRALASKFKSPTISAYADLWHARAGADDATGRTYHEAVQRESAVRLQKAFDAMEPFAKSPEAMRRVQDLLRFPNRTDIKATASEREAAKTVRDLLKDTLDYRRAAGEDIGEVSDGYFPRVLNVEQVVKNSADFKQRAERLYRSIGADDPKAAAEAWFTHAFDTYAGIDGGLGFARQGQGGMGTTTSKAREFGKEADRLLADFYEQDTMAVLASYMTGAARRAEYQRRFGMKGPTGSAERAKWEEDHGGKTQWQVMVDKIEDEIRSSGIDPAGSMHILDTVHKSNLGQLGSVSPGTRAVLGTLHAWNQLKNLDRTTITSLTELAAGFVRGGPRYGFKFVADSLHEFGRQLRGADPSDNARWAQAVGVGQDAMVNQMILSRSGIDQTGKGTQAVLAKFHKATGLHQFTEGTRTGAVTMGRHFIATLAADLDSPRARTRKRAEVYLKELGIRNPAEFAKAMKDGGPSLQEVMDGKTAMGQDYATALLRFVNQTIMSPSRAEKPTYASHPVGSLFYSLLGWSYAFKKNALDRVGRLAVRGVREADPAHFLPAAGLGMTALFGYMVDTYVRPSLFGSTYDFDNETLGEAALRTADRAGLLGALSPAVNAVKGFKYQRSLAESVSGPILGTIAADASKPIQMAFGRNSPGTNTAERAAAAALYDSIIEPAADALAAKYLRGIFATGAVLGTGNREGGVLPSDREAFVSAVAGEKNQ